MRGHFDAAEVYAPARAFYKDGNYSREEWVPVFMAIGDPIRRLWFIGDRILDAIEGRNERDQWEVPPGLAKLINEYRSLINLPPVRLRNTYQAHTIVLKTQGKLISEEVRDELLQDQGEVW